VQEINLNDIDFGSLVSIAQNKQKTHISSGIILQRIRQIVVQYFFLHNSNHKSDIHQIFLIYILPNMLLFYQSYTLVCMYEIQNTDNTVVRCTYFYKY